MRVLELMKTHVQKTTPEATLTQAVDLMDLYQVSGLPVVDAEGRLCGMLSECDVVNAVRQHGVDASSLRVGDAMTQPPIYVRDTEAITEAVHRLLHEPYKRLPVVTDTMQVIGTLNRVDIVQAIFEGVLSVEE